VQDAMEFLDILVIEVFFCSKTGVYATPPQFKSREKREKAENGSIFYGGLMG
jgi:hypothetical protein